MLGVSEVYEKGQSLRVPRRDRTKRYDLDGIEQRDDGFSSIVCGRRVSVYVYG